MQLSLTAVFCQCVCFLLIQFQLYLSPRCCRKINTGPGDSGTPWEESRQSQWVGAKSSPNSCLKKPICE